MSCHGYEGVMSVLCTPLQVKCYQEGIGFQFFVQKIHLKTYWRKPIVVSQIKHNTLCTAATMYSTVQCILPSVIRFSPCYLKKAVTV